MHRSIENRWSVAARVDLPPAIWYWGLKPSVPGAVCAARLEKFFLQAFSGHRICCVVGRFKHKSLSTPCIYGTL
jgi:hypothetical protein